MPGIVGLIGALVASKVTSGGGSAPAPAAPTPAPTVATANATKQNQEAALSQQFPSIQQLTGGSLSPESWARLSELLSGQAGTPGIGEAAQDLLKKAFSVSASSNPSVTTGGLTA